MKTLIIIILLIVVINKCWAVDYGNEWYVGGTLQGSTLEQWSYGTTQNKAATCASWMLRLYGESRVALMGGVSALLPQAAGCVHLVDEASTLQSPKKKSAIAFVEALAKAGVIGD